MSKKVVLFLLLGIIAFAFLLRIINLTNIPPGINRDEGSIAFTAYSLIKTGADEYGRHLPFSFESFGDWKLPLYIYTVVPFVGVFGMSELAVRLPSVIFGTGSVILIYFLADYILKNKKLSLIVALLAAIEPWSVHLSRVESESNTAVFLGLAALLLFLKALNKNRWAFIPSGVLFALTYFTYAGNHVFTTLFLVGLLVIYKKEIKIGKELKIGILLFAILSSFIFYQTLIVADHTKLSGIGIFGDPAIVHAKIEIPRNEHSNPSSLVARITHNRIEFAAERFLQNYLNSFSPQFLFIKGGENMAHNIQNFGNMYLIEGLFFYLGIAVLLLRQKGKERNLILWWLLIGPIAASITKDAPHSNRMFAIFPALPITTTIGVYYLLSIIPKKTKLLASVAITICFAFNFLIYLDRYFVHFPRDEAQNWGLGYKQLSSVLSSQKYAYSSVVITQPQTSPYIFLLFYMKYDPAKYQGEAMRYPLTDDGFFHVRQFGRFEFRNIDWEKDINSGKLVIANPTEIPLDIQNKYSVDKITLPDGSAQFLLIKK